MKKQLIKMCGPCGVIWRVKIRVCKHNYGNPKDFPDWAGNVKTCPKGCFNETKT